METLNNIAGLLQIKEEKSVKARIFKRAAGDIAALNEDVLKLVQQDRLSDFEGLGRTIQTIINEIEDQGSSSFYEKLCQEYPPELLELLKIPGIGPKTVRLLYQHLQITDLDALTRAAEDGQLRSVPGIGKKNEHNLVRALTDYQEYNSGIILGYVWELADRIMEFLQPLETIESIIPVGSLRRGRELLNDLDLLVISRDEAAVRRKLHSYSGFSTIKHEAEGELQAVQEGIPIEFIIVPPEESAFRLLWCTGSKQHRNKIFAGRRIEDFLNFSSEQEIYEALRLHYIPPEMRENWGEIELARLQNWPQLVEQFNLQGDFHVRLNWEQGAEGLGDLVQAARAMGYRYMVLTNISGAPMRRSLLRDQLMQQFQAIDEINERISGFRVIKGLECEVARDGSIHLDPVLEREADLVIARVNHHYRMNSQQQTERMLQAIENPAVDMIERLSGRLLKQRGPMDMDYENLLAVARQHQVMIGLSSWPDSLDIGEDLSRMAHRMGVKVAICSEASSPAELQYMRLGIKVARRAGLVPDDVSNCMSLARLLGHE